MTGAILARSEAASFLARDTKPGAEPLIRARQKANPKMLEHYSRLRDGFREP